MDAPPITAALTLSLTGPFARQGTGAAEAVRLWAGTAGARLILVDDGGSRSAVVRAYATWLARGDVDLLLGPCGSGLTRAVVPLAREAGRLLWNHGGSADDLMQPGVASMLTPASRYFDGAIDEAATRRIERVLVVQGAGPFARAVADGAVVRSAERGLDVRVIDVDALPAENPGGNDEDVADLAVLTAGRFEHDVEVVQRVHGWRHPPALLGAVAAGIPEFEDIDLSERLSSELILAAAQVDERIGAAAPPYLTMLARPFTRSRGTSTPPAGVRRSRPVRHGTN